MKHGTKIILIGIAILACAAGVMFIKANDNAAAGDEIITVQKDGTEKIESDYDNREADIEMIDIEECQEGLTERGEEDNTPKNEEQREVIYNPIKPVVEVGIACWGDSMMEGIGSGEAYIQTKEGIMDISYFTAPSALEYFTGIRTYNFGVGGETSEEIAVRAGGIRLYTDRDIVISRTYSVPVLLYDASGNIYNCMDYSGYGIEENDCADTCYINGFLCNVNAVPNSRSVDISLYDGDINGDIDSVYIPAKTVVIPKAAYEHTQDILVLEIGSNGGWNGDYDELIRQYRQIINNSSCTNYIIVGDTDDPGSSIADYYQELTDENGDFIGTRDTYWEAALREEFGEHFLNTRVYLIENGLSDCGLTPTGRDLLYGQMGCISPQLRDDWTHFNSYGYFSKGKAIYLKGIELGYWS